MQLLVALLLLVIAEIQHLGVALIGIHAPQNIGRGSRTASRCRFTRSHIEIACGVEGHGSQWLEAGCGQRHSLAALDTEDCACSFPGNATRWDGTIASNKKATIGRRHQWGRALVDAAQQFEAVVGTRGVEAIDRTLAPEGRRNGRRAQESVTIEAAISSQHRWHGRLGTTVVDAAKLVQHRGLEGGWQRLCHGMRQGQSQCQSGNCDTCNTPQSGLD